MKVGSKIGASISNWKENTRPNSKAARVFSKIGGFIGSAIEIIAVLGLLLDWSVENRQNFWRMVGLFAIGLIIDMGSHWIAIRMDKKLSAK